ncbi:MAG: carboxylesterase family protein, partial [Bacteroidota bacterium]
ASLMPGLAGGTVKRGEAPPMPQPIGAPHACEIEYCMGNLPLVEEYAWTPEDYEVSNTIQNYFANFIKSGNPNGEGLSEWAPAAGNDATPPVMIIDVESKQVKAAKEARFEFLEKAYHNEK